MLKKEIKHVPKFDRQEFNFWKRPILMPPLKHSLGFYLNRTPTPKRISVFHTGYTFSN